MLEKIKRLYQLRKISAYRGINGWLTKKEAYGLYSTASKLPPNAFVVEIGSWQGKSTYCIAKGMQSGKIYAIDPFNSDGGEDHESTESYSKVKLKSSLLDIFKENMQRLNVSDKIIIKEGYSYQFHDDFKKEIDFLFIDGDHSIKGTQTDVDLYAHKVKVGGYLAFHDYYANRPELGPTYVIHEKIMKSDEYVFCGLHDSLWICQKVK